MESSSPDPPVRRHLPRNQNSNQLAVCLGQDISSPASQNASHRPSQNTETSSSPPKQGIEENPTTPHVRYELRRDQSTDMIGQIKQNAKICAPPWVKPLAARLFTLNATIPQFWHSQKITSFESQRKIQCNRKNKVEPVLRNSWSPDFNPGVPQGFGTSNRYRF